MIKEMTIPEGFPKFSDRRELIVVSGTKEGAIYLGSDGSFDEISSFKLPERLDIEKEVSKRATLADGTTLGNRGSLDNIGENEEEEYRTLLRSEAKSAIASSKASKMIVIAPEYAIKVIIESVDGLGVPVVLGGKGNFVKHDPKDILLVLKESGFV